MLRSAGWPLTLFMALLWSGEVQAQATVVYGSGIGFSYQRRHLTVTGFLTNGYPVGIYVGTPIVPGPFGPVYFLPPPAPFGVSTTRVTINYYLPRSVVVSPARDDDLKGVDLDLVRPDGKAPARARQPEAARPPEPAAPAAQPQKPPREPPPPPPADNPREASGRLIELGLTAFGAQEYGLAAQRFRQAIVADPQSPRGHFLLAQAEFALGKYRDAVAVIQDGMRLQPDWPRASFQPRLDLYKGNELEFVAHLKRLDDVLEQRPHDRFFLFLYAYQLWFDGRRIDALPLFQRARAGTPNTTFIDAFLNVGAAGVVAAR